MKEEFDSVFKACYEVKLPEYTGVRIMMMPVIIGNPDSIPEFVKQYRALFEAMCGDASASDHAGGVGYMTVDEQYVKAGKSSRRKGLHVDGAGKETVIRRIPGGPAEGTVVHVSGGRCFGAIGNGMLTVSTPSGCKAYNQTFTGRWGDEGECEHMRSQCMESASRVFEPSMMYWLDGLCVHESLPMDVDTRRQFVRLSLPSDGPWFEGYTVNPTGILPVGPILPRRAFMDM
jgi:hypothetical protein